MSISESDLRRYFAQQAELHCVDMLVSADTRLAAVALIFWQRGDDLHLCLGRRTIDPRDPWSGDLAFPGGKAEAGDGTLHTVAARETCEEVGLHLPNSALLGRMPKLQARGGRERSTTPVWPLVYLLDAPPSPFRLSDEMSAAHWVPVVDFWDRRNWIAFSFPPTRAQRAGIAVGDHYLWGFSLHLLIELGEQLGRPLRAIQALETTVHVDFLDD